MTPVTATPTRPRTITLLDPSEMVSTLVLGIMAILVLLPLVYLVLTSFSPDPDIGSPSWLSNYTSTFGLERYNVAIKNSVILSLVAPILSLAAAIPVAWVLARTDVPGTSFIFALVFGAFVTPGFVNALAWLLLLSPKTGYANQLWSLLWGDNSVLLNIYSFPGLVLASLSAIYPVAVVFLYNAFSMLDPDMEESARVAGASPSYALRTVTLPLVRSAVVASLIVMMLESLVLFATPAIIGLPAQIPTVTTQLWYLFQSYPIGIGRAAALSLPLMLVTAVLLWLQRRLSNPVSNARMSRVVKARVSLGLWRWPVFALLLGILMLTFIIPMVVMIVTSVSDQWLRGLSFSNLTLKNYAALLSNGNTLLAIGDSLLTASAAAFICIFVGGLSAYFAERRASRLGGFLAFLSMVPLAVPSMVYAVGIFTVFAPPPMRLYGTLFILVLAYTSKAIPFAFMSIRSAIASVPIALEDTARVLGASRLRTLCSITVPLTRGGMLAGWLLVFVLSLKELPASILLYTVRTPVIGTEIMELYSVPRWEEMAALSIVLLTMSSVVIFLARQLMGGSATGRRI